MGLDHHDVSLCRGPSPWLPAGVLENTAPNAKEIAHRFDAVDDLGVRHRAGRVPLDLGIENLEPRPRIVAVVSVRVQNDPEVVGRYFAHSVRPRAVALASVALPFVSELSISDETFALSLASAAVMSCSTVCWVVRLLAMNES